MPNNFTITDFSEQPIHRHALESKKGMVSRLTCFVLSQKVAPLATGEIPACYNGYKGFNSLQRVFVSSTSEPYILQRTNLRAGFRVSVQTMFKQCVSNVYAMLKQCC